MITLTDWELSTLKCVAASGKSFQVACEEIKRAPKTVRQALSDMGLEDIRARFYRGNRSDERKDGGIKVLSLEQIRQRPVRVPENPPAYWLARRWAA